MPHVSLAQSHPTSGIHSGENSHAATAMADAKQEPDSTCPSACPSSAASITKYYGHNHEAIAPLAVDDPRDIDAGAPYRLEKNPTTRSIAELPPAIYQNKFEIWTFVGCSALATVLSTICIPIFFPTLTILSEYFNTSVDMINLTATMYSIFQGISPLFWGAMSDWIGRRPVYFGCIICYIGANIGLALAPSYWVLFGLRCLQAFGGASTVVLLGTVVGDITERKNRGGLMGIASGLGLLGNCFGPLIGGALIKRWDWRSIFWFLAALGLLTGVLLFFVLPETHRSFAGTGALYPKRWLNRSPYAYIRHFKAGLPYFPSDLQYQDQWKLPPRRPKPFKWMHLLFQVDVILVLIPLALHYTTWYMLLTIQSTALSSDYGMSVDKVGYTYLSSGVGTFVASVASGKLLNWEFKRHMAGYKRRCEERNEHFHASRMNIYRARLETAFPATLLLLITSIIFGWTIQHKVSFYVPVVMTFFISCTATFFLSATSTILVDMFPEDSGSATALANLARCCMCAAGLAAVDSMVRAMGAGGTSTLMAGFCVLSDVCLLAVMKYGRGIAIKRRHRIRDKMLKFEEKNSLP